MNKDQVYYAKKYKQQGRANRFIINGIWFDPGLNRYVDFGRCRRKYSAYVKKHCNKKLRRYEFDSTRQKGLYRKMTEYWWEIY